MRIGSVTPLPTSFRTMYASKHQTALACCLLLVIESSAQALFKAPFLRIVELDLCRSYHLQLSPGSLLSDDLSEEDCKAIAIQRDLAMINAYNVAMSSIIEIMTAFPYASLCARFSRRRILAANIVGTVTASTYTICICYYHQIFNIRLILCQSLWRLFGGGDSVLLSIANALIAESLPATHLSKVLFLLNALRLIVNAIGQMVGARLMQENLWAPALTGVTMYCLAIPVLCWIVDPQDHTRRLKLSDDASDETTDLLLAGVSARTKERNGSPMRLRMWTPMTRAVWRTSELFREPATAMALAIVFLNELGHGVNSIVQQWSSRSFGWTLAHTNYFVAGQRLVAAATLVGFSWAFHGLQKVGIASARLDIGLVNVCQWLTLVGMLTAAMSCLSGVEGTRVVVFVCAVLIYMMGWGMTGALQSSMTRSIPRAQVTMLYTGLNVADRMAGIVSGPMFAGLMTAGFQEGGRWTYLPFWVSVGLFVVVAVLTRHVTSWLSKGIRNADEQTRVAE